MGGREILREGFQFMESQDFHLPQNLSLPLASLMVNFAGDPFPPIQCTVLYLNGCMPCGVHVPIFYQKKKWKKINHFPLANIVNLQLFHNVGRNKYPNNNPLGGD